MGTGCESGCSVSTFTTTKLTRKQAHALLRTMAQSLNESEAAGHPAERALCDAFGAPSATGDPREVLTRKLLGQCIRTGAYHSGERAIGLRAAYRHEPASARWGAIQTNNKGTLVVPTIDDAWACLAKLADRYKIGLARVKQGTGQGAAGGPAQPLPAGVTELVLVEGPAHKELDPAQGTHGRGTAFGKMPQASARTLARPVFPHAPMLARALAAHTRAHEKRAEDGDTLHSDAACALSLRLREPIMARHERARSSVPALQLWVDVSGSMSSKSHAHKDGKNRQTPAAAAANAIMDACRLAHVPVQCLQFGTSTRCVSDWKERAWAQPLAKDNDTDLPMCLSSGLPLLAQRTERRKLALVLTDGAVGYSTTQAECGVRGQPLTHWRRYADAHGIELYAIGLGVDVPHGPDTFHGAIRIDKPEELCSTAARELARVISRGERVAV